MADEVRRLGADFFWGPIAAAREKRATVADMWGAMRDELARANAAAPEGVTYAFASDILQQVNGRSSNAASLTRAEANLAAAAPESAILGTMIGQPFYGRSLESQQAFAKWEARAEMIMDTPAGQVSQWVTVQYTAGNLPDTLGDLQDDIEGTLLDWADRYGGTYAATGRLQLNAI